MTVFTDPKVILAIIVVLTNACSQSSTAPVLSINGFTMGTSYSVQINTNDTGNLQDNLRNAIEVILNRINLKMSTYIDNSELSQINTSTSTEWLPVSDELYDVISTAHEISIRTAGAFDVTIGPLVNQWGFGPEDRNEIAPPPDAIIRRLSEYVDYRQLKLRSSPPEIRKLKAGINIDLSGLAKGYAVDKISEYLDSSGFENYMVEIGGELRAKGFNYSGKPWRIGIEEPLTEGRAVHKIIHLDHTAMATSGNYRNYFTVDDIHYSHEIDPKTGWPVSHHLVSVTVLGHSAMVADALATGLLVMGPDDGVALAERENIPALFIVSSAEGYLDRYTGGFKRSVVSPDTWIQ